MYSVLTGLGVSSLDWQVLRLRLALMPVELAAAMVAERLIGLLAIPSGARVSCVQQWLGSFIQGPGSLLSQNG